MTLCTFCAAPVNVRKAVSCSYCGVVAHSACISSAVDLVAILNGNNGIRGLSWKCDGCIAGCTVVNSNELSALIEEKVRDAMNALVEAFNSMKSDLLKLNVETRSTIIPPSTESIPTYSQVLNNKAQPAVILQPKDTSQTNARTKEDLIKCIDPANADFSFSKVKQVSNGGILLGCKTTEDSEKFMKLAKEKLSGDYNIRESPGIHPRIRVSGICDNLSEDSLLKLIKKNNMPYILPESDIKLIKLLPTKKNNKIFQAILQVDKFTYERVMKAGKILIGYDSCPVFDGLEVYRCYNCNGFHHSQKNCTKQLCCPRCGDGHLIKDCKSKVLRCCNCQKLKDAIPDISIDHAAWDTKNCTAYDRARAKVRSDILTTA